MGNAVTPAEPLDFFDAHFHVWDTSPNSTSGHEPADLNVPKGDPKTECFMNHGLKAYVPAVGESHYCDACGYSSIRAPTRIRRCTWCDYDLCEACACPATTAYLRETYEAEFEDRLPERLRHTGGVFVESLSVLAAGTAGGKDFSSRCLDELRFADHQLRGGDYLLVPCCALEQDDASQVLAELAASPRVRGIRQALNHKDGTPGGGDPSRSVAGDLLDDASWQAGFSRLSKLGLSFDLQLNPSQLLKAGEFLEQHQDTVVIIDHLGSPTLRDLTTEDRLQYWQGIEFLASLPNTFMKLSFVCRCDREFDRNDEVVEAVHRVIRFFTPRRCMFASNYATDARAVVGRWTADRLFAEYLRIADAYSEEDQRELFAGTARRAYRA